MAVRIEIVVEYYIYYRVTHEDGSSGGADLRIMELEEHHHMYCDGPLREEDVPMESRIAETFFYPHSETSPRRGGVGSEVLGFVLEDARKGM